MNKMNNDLIEAADNFDRNFLLNNENLLFSNMEFFEKFFLNLIENKKNKTIIFILKNFENNIPIRIFNVGLYHSLTKKNNAIFQYYYKYQTKYMFFEWENSWAARKPHFGRFFDLFWSLGRLYNVYKKIFRNILFLFP